MAEVTAAQSIAGVLAKVRAVGKDSKNEQQHFNFRGIDAVVNAVNPALKEVGGFIIGEAVSTGYEPFTTAGGKAATSVHLTAKYSWYGTDGGEPISGVVSAEANDLADKATAKAWSVALRTFLLQTLMLPTDEKDPDADYTERGKSKVVPVAGPVSNSAPPAEWRADLAKIHSVEGLQAFYEADAHAWFTDDVKAAFTAKKEALTNG